MTRQQTRKTGALRSPESAAPTAAVGDGGVDQLALAADVDSSNEEALVRARTALVYARAEEYAQKAKYTLAKAAAYEQKTRLVLAKTDLVRAQAASGADREATKAPPSRILKRAAVTSPQEARKKAKLDKTATAPRISRDMHRRLVWFKGVFERHAEMEKLLPEDASPEDIGLAHVTFMEEEEVKLQDDILAQEDEEAREAAHAEDAALAVAFATEACDLSDSS